MELNKVGTLQPSQSSTDVKSGVKDIGKGPSFQETLGQKLNSPQNSLAKPVEIAKAGGLKFSNHAVERMQSRGISFSPDDMKKLGEAVEKAAAKGSKDSLILMNDSALIVSVKNNTVVTVMDKANMKENVFTNIDSTIVM